jgi:hypothetical protein
MQTHLLKNHAKMERLFEIRKTVQDLLTNNPTTRDDDRKLIVEVWKLQKPDIMRIPGLQLIDFLLNKELAAPETIRRTRQKLQQHNPNLRGTSYKVRQEVEQPVVIEDLRDPNWRPGGTP